MRTIISILLAMEVCIICLAGNVAAAIVSNYWETGDGDFNDSTNWREPWIPGSNTVVCFDRVGEVAVRFTANVTNYSAQIAAPVISADRNIVFDLGGNHWGVAHEHYSAFSVGRGNATVRVTNGRLSAHGIWLRGDETTLIFSGSNTICEIASWGAVGYDEARPLLRVESGARMNISGSLQIPRAGGSGFVEVSGDNSVLTARLFVGYAAGSRGELTVADGARLICPANLEVAPGIGSYGVLIIDGGSVTHTHSGGWNLALRWNSLLRVVLHAGQAGALITSAADVMLDGGAFELSLAEGFNCNTGDMFTIIEPAAGKGFVGEGIFADLPEGSVISAEGFKFKVSYTGGENTNSFTLESTGK